MSGTLPPPPVPPDCDLRDLDGFMLNTERLLASELWALADGKWFKAAVALWCRAWKQVPAASLPDDDLVIAAFAGVTVKQLQAERWVILRGFTKHSDGRLYHKTLAEDACRAWSAKQRRRAERDGDAGRLRDWRERRRNGNETADETSNETEMKRVSHDDGNATETPTKRVRQGQGQGQGQVGGNAQPPTPTSKYSNLQKALRGLGLPSNPEAIEEWAEFLRVGCVIQDQSEIPLAFKIIGECATRDGVRFQYAKHCGQFAREVARRLQKGREKQQGVTQ